jgi:hypothetical protein
LANTDDVVIKDRRPPGALPLGLEARRSLVEQGAKTAGEEWAKWWKSELRRQGRAVSGGWPGTLSEARARLLEAVVGDLRGVGVAELTFEEREHGARVLYATARRKWLERRKR